MRDDQDALVNITDLPQPAWQQVGFSVNTRTRMLHLMTTAADSSYAFGDQLVFRVACSGNLKDDLGRFFDCRFNNGQSVGMQPVDGQAYAEGTMSVGSTGIDQLRLIGLSWTGMPGLNCLDERQQVELACVWQRMVFISAIRSTSSTIRVRISSTPVPISTVPPRPGANHVLTLEFNEAIDPICRVTRGPVEHEAVSRRWRHLS